MIKQLERLGFIRRTPRHPSRSRATAGGFARNQLTGRDLHAVSTGVRPTPGGRVRTNMTRLRLEISRRFGGYADASSHHRFPRSGPRAGANVASSVGRPRVTSTMRATATMEHDRDDDTPTAAHRAVAAQRLSGRAGRLFVDAAREHPPAR